MLDVQKDLLATKGACLNSGMPLLLWNLKTGYYDKFTCGCLFEGLENIFRYCLGILVRNGLFIECRHAWTGGAHFLDNALPVLDPALLQILLVEGLFRVYHVASVSVAGSTVLFE
jgi:hypothetical protein